ncbi:MAG: cysteine desulfurase family protein [Acidimicrobiia bacterium]
MLRTGTVSDRPMAYLDHAATTPMRPEAIEAMLPFLSTRFANPSGGHAFARDARLALDDARDEVAAVLGVDAGEIVFTGDGTEADNLAVMGVHKRRGGTVVCASAEHHAVLGAVEALGGRVVAVDGVARIDLDALRAALDDTVCVVSAMAVNNEVGTVNPLHDIARVVRKKAKNAVFHTDAVQALTWIDPAEIVPHVDLLSLSGHKFGGPKGVGVLYVRDGVKFDALKLGGGQERERRSGTQNVAGIAALATALRITHADRKSEVERIETLRNRFLDTLLATVDGVRETVPRDVKVAGSAHVCFDGVESEALLFLLEREGVYASAGSSCASGATQISHVLEAMGTAREDAAGAVRFSFGYASTADDVDRALAAIPPAVERLRR